MVLILLVYDRDGCVSSVLNNHQRMSSEGESLSCPLPPPRDQRLQVQQFPIKVQGMGVLNATTVWDTYIFANLRSVQLYFFAVVKHIFRA